MACKLDNDFLVVTASPLGSAKGPVGSSASAGERRENLELNAGVRERGL